MKKTYTMSRRNIGEGTIFQWNDKMTEMIGAGVTQCRKCRYYIVGSPIGYCYNVNSDHYGHAIMMFHPICDEFWDKEAATKHD